VEGSGKLGGKGEVKEEEEEEEEEEEAGPALHPAPKGAALAARRGKPRSAAPCVELEWQDAYVSTSLESRRSG